MWLPANIISEVLVSLPALVPGNLVKVSQALESWFPLQCHLPAAWSGPTPGSPRALCLDLASGNEEPTGQDWGEGPRETMLTSEPSFTP